MEIILYWLEWLANTYEKTTCMHSLHWSGVISRVEKAKYARRFVLWKSSEYKKMAINFVLEGMERLYLEIFILCLHFQKKKVHIVFLDKVS